MDALKRCEVCDRLIGSTLALYTPDLSKLLDVCRECVDKPKRKPNRFGNSNGRRQQAYENKPALTLAEAARLEETLVREGSLVDQGAIPNILKGLAARSDFSHGDAEAVAQISNFVRNCKDHEARALALGALKLVAAGALGQHASFALRLALHKVQSIAPEVAPPRLTESEQSDALAVFEAARGDRTLTDQELTDAAARFIARFHNDASMFGRLAADLGFLLRTWRSVGATPSERETARAALTYFAFASDALPDDESPSGLIDDAFVVQRAVHELQPERAVMSRLLGEITQQWPLLRDLALATNDSAYRPSDFMTLSLALLLETDSLDPHVKGRALVVADAGPLPVILGLLRALLETASYAAKPTSPSYNVGDRLRNRASGAEVIFDGFERSEGKSLIPSDFASATHFAFVTAGKKKGGRQHQPIQTLKSFEPSARTGGSLRRGEVILDLERVGLGPLERLLGLAGPISLPPTARTVVVVSQIGESRALIEEMTLLGSRIHDVISIAHVRLNDDEPAYHPWSKSGAGVKHQLVIATSAADAAFIVEQNPESVAAVVVAVKYDSTDVLHLNRIVANGTRVLALVVERDRDSQEALEQSGFSFWCWDDARLKLLQITAPGSTQRHPISAFEEQVCTSRVDERVVATELPGLSEAYAELEKLDRGQRTLRNDVLEQVLGEAFGVLVSVSRCIAPPGSLVFNEFEARVSNLERQITNGAKWWPDEMAASATQVYERLRASVQCLRTVNPKWDVLASWARERDGGLVIGNRQTKEVLSSAPLPQRVVVSDRVDFSDVSVRTLIPGWFPRSKMERALFPPISNDLTLLLYGPERDWHSAFRTRRSRGRAFLGELVERRGAFRGFGNPARARPPTNVAPMEVETPFDPEDISLRARRAHALRVVDSQTAESVPGRLVHFAGGYWAVFAPQHVVVYLLKDPNLPDEEATLGEKTARDVQVGDLVLLLRGSDRDALRGAVDAEAPNKARHYAATWQRALRRYLEKGHSLQKLGMELRNVGCARELQTLKKWRDDEMMIGPRRGAADIDAIARATGDEELQQNLKTCIASVEKLRGLHLSVAHRLANRVLDTARAWLEAGAAPDTLIEIEGRIVLVSVEAIDPTAVEVPRRFLNQLQEDRWHE